MDDAEDEDTTTPPTDASPPILDDASTVYYDADKPIDSFDLWDDDNFAFTSTAAIFTT